MAARVVHFFAVLCKTTGRFEYGDAENNAESEESEESEAESGTWR